MFGAEVEIDRPVREVYRVFADPETLPRWLTGLQRTEQVSGTPGEVGSVTRRGVHANLYVDFIDKGDSTVMRFSSDFQSKGLMMKLMMPFIKGQIRKRQEGDLRKFKDFVESETA